MVSNLIHIYTGDGKGKTTAAMGLAVRALGAGHKVYIGQFIKDIEYAEIRLMKSLSLDIDIELYGTGEGCIWPRGLNNNDTVNAQIGLDKAINAIKSSKYNLVILDEIFVALKHKILTEEQILGLMADARANNVELALTGRYASENVMNNADLVTNMQCIKHYHKDLGLLPRDGIER
ncbi:MAG: cob(I)yrinic acid a,c-diamide adenosyltransferase [Chloroflexi bacterium]|nr:cob(I)yrinic acid a,c-diamide adenosyltransferase [Chloroflexota bacterium]